MAQTLTNFTISDSVRKQRIVVLSPCPGCKRVVVTRAFERFADCPMCGVSVDAETETSGRS